MIRDCLYCRVSTLEQDSLDVQLAANRRVSERDGATILAQLHDKESGLVETRDGYQRLLALCRERAVDRVVVWRVDRFGRDAAESIARYKEISRLGVQIVSATEGPQDEFLFQLLSVLAQRESRSTQLRVLIRMRDIVEREGRYLSRPPFGYRVSPGKSGYLEIVEHEAALVRSLFTLYATGSWSIHQLVLWTNQQSDPTTGKPWQTRPRTRYNRQSGEKVPVSGGPFRFDNISDILRNETYTGHFVWGRRMRSKLDGHAARPEGEHIRPPATGGEAGADAAVPAIIETALFDDVQRLLAAARPQPRRHPGSRGPFLLTGLLYCGECRARGSTTTRMVGSWASGKRSKRKDGSPVAAWRYLCERQERRGVCALKPITGSTLEKAILMHLAQVLPLAASMDDLLALAEAEHAQREQDADQHQRGQSQMASLRTALAGTRRQKDRLADLLTSGVMPPDEYRRALERYRSAEAVLAEQITRLERQSGQTVRQSAQHAAILFGLPRALAAGTREEQSALLARCVQSIILRQTRPLEIEITWHPWLSDLAASGLVTLPPARWQVAPKGSARTHTELTRAYRQRHPERYQKEVQAQISKERTRRAEKRQKELQAMAATLPAGDLSDEQWSRIAPLLPPKSRGVAARGFDDRAFVNALLWMARSGASWPELPERYGRWRQVATRFARWQEQGIVQRVLGELDEGSAGAKGATQ